MRSFIAFLLPLTLALTACGSTGFSPQETQNFTQKMVTKYPNFSEAEVQAMLAQAKYQPKIIAMMNKPAESKPWYAYRQLMINSARIKQGNDFFAAHQAVLQRAQKNYGVSPKMIVAIIGIETNYGKQQGKFKVLDALATLSFDYPRRAPFFQSELETYLWLTKKNGWPVTSVTGSYAGAFGMCQFMPSSYRNYAVSANPNNHAPDISNSADDAIMSVANYFARSGWQAGAVVAMPVTVHGNRYQALKTNSLKPNYTLAELAAVGVDVPKNLSAQTKASLAILKSGPDQQETWLTFHNFYVITRYNAHINYAMAAYQLSQEL